jgi:hypothetical protein
MGCTDRWEEFEGQEMQDRWMLRSLRGRRQMLWQEGLGIEKWFSRRNKEFDVFLLLLMNIT